MSHKHTSHTLLFSHRQPRDFVQTKKLYEGKIAAVVQGYHAASGRPLALKVYNRARLDTMERFQVRNKMCDRMCQKCEGNVGRVSELWACTTHVKRVTDGRMCERTMEAPGTQGIQPDTMEGFQVV